MASLIRPPVAVAVALPMASADTQGSTLIDDLRFFATVWLGGFVFFGTLFA